jgi:HPt (histidine-containing phosphotransfer) domain-containing protein
LPRDNRHIASANPATLKMFGAKSVAEFTALGPWIVSPERHPAHLSARHGHRHPRRQACRTFPEGNLAQAIARSFLADIPGRIQALLGHLDARDAKGVESQAHTIKGAALTVGSEGLAKLALALEQVGKAGDLMSATAGFGMLNSEFQRLQRAMEASPLLGGTLLGAG